MRVILNALDFHPSRMGGMETYFRNLLGSLQEVCGKGEDRFTVITVAPNAAAFPIRNPAFGHVEFPFAKPSAGWFFRAAVRRITGRDVLSPRINRIGADLLHHPFSTVNTKGLRFPYVLSCMDLQHEYYPSYFSRAELRRRRKAYRSSAEGAVRIIAISAYTRSTLTEAYGIDPGKVDVVHLGCSGDFRPIPDRERLERVRARYGLERPFLYYPAATWPHKNHGTLLEALRILAGRRDFEGGLVLTGIPKQSHGDLLRRLRQLDLEERVKVLGYLDGEDLPALYNLAELLVFPSLFEGFGIPVVEAMACGCPVACSDSTSLPEVAGDAAIRFDPRSAEAMAEAVYRLWRDPGLREECRRKGLARAAMFRWEKTARETIAVYRKAAGAA